MYTSDNGTIKVSPKLISTAAVLRHGITTALGLAYQVGITGFQKGLVLTQEKVKAIAEIYHSPNNERLFVTGPFNPVFRPLHSANWITFPEINPRAEPIKKFVALTKFCVMRQRTFAHGPVTPVIAEDERCSRSAQILVDGRIGGCPRLVIGGELPILINDPTADQRRTGGLRITVRRAGVLFNEPQKGGTLLVGHSAPPCTLRTAP